VAPKWAGHGNHGQALTEPAAAAAASGKEEPASCRRTFVRPAHMYSGKARKDDARKASLFSGIIRAAGFAALQDGSTWLIFFSDRRRIVDGHCSAARVLLKGAKRSPYMSPPGQAVCSVCPWNRVRRRAAPYLQPSFPNKTQGSRPKPVDISVHGRAGKGRGEKEEKWWKKNASLFLQF
jgi:hypothetical protein